MARSDPDAIEAVQRARLRGVAAAQVRSVTDPPRRRFYIASDRVAEQHPNQRARVTASLLACPEPTPTQHSR